MAALFDEKKSGMPRVQRKKLPNARLEELRALKKDLRKARRKLLRSGAKGTEAERVISKRWFAVMHEHAKISRLLQTRDEARRNTKKQSKCRADPMKLGGHCGRRSSFWGRRLRVFLKSLP